MTSYFATSTSQDLAIKAVAYELRIILVNLYSTGGGNEVIHLFRHSGSTLSGGTATDIVPLHQGAPAASTTGQVGSSLSFSGTSLCVGSAFMPDGQTSTISGSTVITIKNGSAAPVQPPLTMTVSPGSVFHVSGLTSGTIAQIFFEE